MIGKKPRPEIKKIIDLLKDIPIEKWKCHYREGVKLKKVYFPDYPKAVIHMDFAGSHCFIAFFIGTVRIELYTKEESQIRIIMKDKIEDERKRDFEQSEKNNEDSQKDALKYLE